MNTQKVIWNRLINGPHSDDMLRTAMRRVARGLSDMSGWTFSNGDPQIERVPISQITAHAGDPETEKVGIYMVMSDGLYGQTILILSITSALHLVDLLMGDPPGTATALGAMERSALSEVGNLAVASFLNTMAAQNPQSTRLMRPSPPAVMVDMLGAILSVIVTPVAAVRDDLVIIKTELEDAQQTVQGCFWVIPDPALRELAI